MNKEDAAYSDMSAKRCGVYLRAALTSPDAC